MHVYLKRLCKLRLERKSECKKSLKKLKRKLKLSWVKKVLMKSANSDKSAKCMIEKREDWKIKKSMWDQANLEHQKAKTQETLSMLIPD